MVKIMKNRLQKIPAGLKSGAVYTFSTIFSRGLAIITVPIFTRLMTTEEIGIVNLYNSWYSLISTIATLSLTSGGYVIAIKEFEGKRDQYDSSILSLTSFIAVLIATVYFIVPTFWSNVFGISGSLICLMLIGFLFAPARDFWLARQRYEYRYKLSGVLSILSAIVASGLAVFAVISLNRKQSAFVAEGRLYANYIIIYSVAAVIWLYIMLKGKTFYNREFWKYSLRLSLPLVGYSVASQILTVSDRMMISKLIGNSAVGIYGTLYTVSSLSLMLWQAINTSFVPYLFQNIDRKQNNIKTISFQLLSVYAGFAILLTLFAPEIVKILATGEYYEAINMMPPIAAGVFFTAITHLYSNIAVYHKKTKYVMYPALIAAIINLILNAICIKPFGYMAAAYTTLFSYIVLAVLQAMWGRKIHKNITGTKETVYDDKKFFYLSFATTAVIMCALILYRHTIIRYIVLLVGIILFTIYVWKLIKQLQ